MDDRFRSLLEDAYRAVDEIELERNTLHDKLRDAIPLLATSEVTSEDIASVADELRWLADGLVRRRLSAAQDEADALDDLSMTPIPATTPAGAAVRH